MEKIAEIIAEINAFVVIRVYSTLLQLLRIRRNLTTMNTF